MNKNAFELQKALSCQVVGLIRSQRELIFKQVLIRHAGAKLTLKFVDFEIVVFLLRKGNGGRN